MNTRHTARAKRYTDALTDTETSKRALCARLFDSPDSISDVLSHEVTSSLSIEPHTHTDLIQFDIIAGCEGQVIIDGQHIQVNRTTLMVAYPGEPHGYTLRPGSPPSEVWLVKIRAPRAWRSSSHRPFPSVLTGLPPQAALLESIVGFTTYWVKNATTATGIACLAKAIAAWPTHAADLPEELSDPIPAEGESALSRVRRVAYTLAQRTTEPPDLDEMADTAELSPRHFARLFRQEFGCTPHAYVAAQRLESARKLLLTPGVTVGQASEQLGFTTTSAFSRWFTRVAGRSPRQFRKDPSTF